MGFLNWSRFQKLLKKNNSFSDIWVSLAKGDSQTYLVHKNWTLMNGKTTKYLIKNIRVYVWTDRHRLEHVCESKTSQTSHKIKTKSPIERRSWWAALNRWKEPFRCLHKMKRESDFWWRTGNGRRANEKWQFSISNVCTGAIVDRWTDVFAFRLISTISVSQNLIKHILFLMKKKPAKLILFKCDKHRHVIIRPTFYVNFMGRKFYNRIECEALFRSFIEAK